MKQLTQQLDFFGFTGRRRNESHRTGVIRLRAKDGPLNGQALTLTDLGDVTRTAEFTINGQRGYYRRLFRGSGMAEWVAS